MTQKMNNTLALRSFSTKTCNSFVAHFNSWTTKTCLQDKQTATKVAYITFFIKYKKSQVGERVVLIPPLPPPPPFNVRGLNL